MERTSPCNAVHDEHLSIPDRRAHDEVVMKRPASAPKARAKAKAKGGTQAKEKRLTPEAKKRARERAQKAEFDAQLRAYNELVGAAIHFDHKVKGKQQKPCESCRRSKWTLGENVYVNEHRGYRQKFCQRCVKRRFTNPNYSDRVTSDEEDGVDHDADSDSDIMADMEEDVQSVS
eukprot:TRINITY_DN33499_c0_g1_i1.p1 TRINITY_DN33499_c0_g1~~TRINITY_DN33499_c0_g1_i1.p1  ORF type:complete len:175 (+),score=29.80 TRINITY_DN33499_c0_g1_i1:71-595(+)